MQHAINLCISLIAFATGACGAVIFASSKGRALILPVRGEWEATDL